MAMPRVTCLMVRNLHLTDNAREILYRNAIEMVRDKKERMRIVGDDFEGEIRTDFKPGFLSTVSGFVFEATVEVGTKTGKARFIVPSEYYEGMERVHWIAITDDSEPCPTTRRSGMLN